jgi:hypothetical protein
MMPLPWNVYALSYDMALDLAKRLDLNGATQFEPSSLASFVFDDENDAFAFVLAHRGIYELSAHDAGHVTVVDTPVENMPMFEAWLRRWCSTPWLATEWVRVSFCISAEKSRFEGALVP